MKHPFEKCTVATPLLRTSPAVDLSKVRAFVRDEVLPRTMSQDEKGQFDARITERMWELGLMTSAVSAEHGGADLPLADLNWLAREIAYGSGGLSVTLIANILAQSPVLLFGSPALRSHVCERILSGYTLWSFAMTELEAGSDLRTIRTEAKPVDGGYALTGEKNFISNGTHSTDLIVFAKLSAGPAAGKVTAFYVRGDTPGLARGLPYKKNGFREADTGRLLLDGAFVPADHLVGQEGQGLEILGRCLGRSKTLVAAACVGLATRALDVAREHLTKTERQGKPLIQQPAVAHLLARLHSELEAGWLLACKAAAHWDAGLRNDLEASMAKLICADTGFKIAGECVELFGSRGFLADNEANRILRDVKGYEIVEGPSLVQEVLIDKLLPANKIGTAGAAPPEKKAA